MSPEQLNRLKQAYKEIEGTALVKTLDDVMETGHRAALSAASSGIGLLRPELAQLWEGIRDAPSVQASVRARGVAADGSIYGIHKYENFDPGWAEAGIKWLENLHNRAPFSDQPAQIDLADPIKIAVVGDWGAGPGTPAMQVANLMQSIQPGCAIHLGDVYYAGSESEERENFLNLWPFPDCSFALNSNHEMYSGARGYFNTLLGNPAFSRQERCSYFAMTNKHWLMMGLDTAYDADANNLYLTGKLGTSQLEFIKRTTQTYGAGRKIMLFSHHEGLDINGKETPLYAEVVGAIGRPPEFWYWGHLHAAIGYANHKGMFGRCVGHGAIPFGDIVSLKSKPFVEFYESQSAHDAHCPERVLNGYLALSIDGARLTETFIAEDGSTRFQKIH